MSYNKVVLNGVCGTEPEVFGKENQGVKFRLVTTESWTTKDGIKKDKDTWHTIVAYNKNKENILRLVKKGSLVFIDGKLNYREWEDSNNNKRESAEIEVVFFDELSKRGANKISEKPDNCMSKKSDEDDYTWTK